MLFLISQGRSVKKCSFNPGLMHQAHSNIPLDAKAEVFMKTLAIFCALQESGCDLDKNTQTNCPDVEESTSYTPIPNLVEVLRDTRSRRSERVSSCPGKLLFEKDKYGHSFIRQVLS